MQSESSPQKAALPLDTIYNFGVSQGQPISDQLTTNSKVPTVTLRFNNSLKQLKELRKVLCNATFMIAGYKFELAKEKTHKVKSNKLKKRAPISSGMQCPSGIYMQ